ncbi:acyl-phosphate glycerol 3-phosphate acyltransferase [Paenibacillus sp. UNC496MF]|uniref:glycerol-3-phosphate acyltransferase n=1 Tax=Paenibacillus sp. UNC496MF TaxID=1502753 RepID=UPI0008EBDDB5|nr:glycerol-3-phosphate acyltransferase [Paenibacillus sp. UNC496MF]SFI80931.1 acyl-phosphate glycerol 3-phosphate acyltransferase [Paenibacillus sp. UNC496MF]
MIIAWTVLSFLCGSLMFSYWLGLLANHNLRDVGDGNPGAINLWKSAGYSYGLAGIALDFLKGCAPLFALAASGALAGYGLVLPAAAAILGHMFSPFLRGRGGKAIAVTFGVWSGLTGFAASLAYAVILAALLAGSRLFTRGKPTTSAADGFQVVAGMLLLTGYLAVAGYPGATVLFGFVSFGLLAYSHRRELRRFLAQVQASRGR